MKAVVTMTPEPKYLAMKNAQAGTPIPLRRDAKTGNQVPRKLPTKMTKTEEMRVPMGPSYSFPSSQVDIVAVSVVDLEPDVKKRSPRRRRALGIFLQKVQCIRRVRGSLNPANPSARN